MKENHHNLIKLPFSNFPFKDPLANQRIMYRESFNIDPSEGYGTRAKQLLEE